jgi:hypothetical protein
MPMQHHRKLARPAEPATAEIIDFAKARVEREDQRAAALAFASYRSGESSWSEFVRVLIAPFNRD